MDEQIYSDVQCKNCGNNKRALFAIDGNDLVCKCCGSRLRKNYSDEGVVCPGFEEEARKEDESEAEDPRDGKIAYKDGRVEILKYGITEISERAYIGNKEIVSVILPAGVTEIKASAFNGCASLENVVLPEGITKMGISVFEGCIKLKNVNIPGGLTRINWDAFKGCVSLETVNISEGVEWITMGAFRDCISLKKVNIPESVLEIENDAFDGCVSLKSIYIPQNAVAYGNPFTRCNPVITVSPENSKLKVIDGNLYCVDEDEGNFIVNYTPKENEKSFSPPDWVSDVACGAFEGAFNLESVTVPGGTTGIGGDVFGNCVNLKSVIIPDSVEKIFMGAFNGCTGLADVYFEGTCSDWERVEIGDDNDAIKNAAVHFITHGKTVYTDGKAEVLEYGTTEIAKNAYFNNENVTEVVLPETVKSIGETAFFGCKAMTSVTIPMGVTEIGNMAFYGCIALEDVYYAGSAEDWSKINIGEANDALENATIHCAYYDGKIVYKDGRVEVLEYGITKIAKGAYKDNKDIVSISLPNSVTDIEDGFLNGAFSGCTGLKSIDLPESLVYIGSSAFQDCKSLTTVNIPDNVIRIGSFAFSRCTSLKSINISDSVKWIYQNAFSDCASLKNIMIPGEVAKIDGYVFQNCVGLTEVLIPKSVTEICDGAFKGCKKLDRICYGGSPEDWKKVKIGKENSKLNGLFGKATLICHCGYWD